MSFLAIRNRRSGNLLSVIGGTMAWEEGASPVSSSKRRIEVEPALIVGDYDREPLFVTRSLELAENLVLTKVGNAYRAYILLELPFDAEIPDMEIVDLATMQVIEIDRCEERVTRLKAANPYRDVRLPA